MLDPIAGYGGVGRDDGVDATGGDAVRDHFDSGVVHVGSDLYGQRNAVAVAFRQRVALRGERSDEVVEIIRTLKRAQARGVERGDVGGDEGRMGVDLAQAGEEIVGRALVRRVEILADVDAQHAAEA